MKPGSWKSFYCNDANGDLTTGYTKCVGGGGFDSFFKTPYNQIVAVYGKGQETNLPAEIRDVRFFFKQFVFAMIKYLQVADKADATLADVDAGVIDPDNLFFDSIGSGQYEFAEYTDRHLVNSLGQDPTDLVISADTLNGLMSDYQFSRDLYRGEAAVYDALILDRQNNKIGAENTALLMNIVGNDIVAANYHDVPGGWTAYKCASENLDPKLAECDGQTIFADANGPVYDESVPPQPLLKKYPGAFANKQTPFAISSQTDIKILETKAFIRSAKVEVPIHVDPFDPTSTALTPHQTLVPWLPKGSGAGFYVAVNGSQDKFVNTHELDFSGTTISLNMNFIYPPDPVTHQDDTTKKPVVAAAETTDFLGEYWICQEGADVLRVRMYTSAQTILQWFTDHPSAVADCDVIFRYGPFGNYLDYITARATGVRLGINPGSGSGRVIDITVYDPAYN